MEKENSNIFANEILNFIESSYSQDDNFLHIRTNELVQSLMSICKNFEGASLMKFMYFTQNNVPRRLFKYQNDLFVTFGLNVFLPGLRGGETYDYPILFGFIDVIEFNYIPVDVNTNNEIEVEMLKITKEECIFSCVLKDDHSKKIFIKSKSLIVEDFVNHFGDYQELKENFYKSVCFKSPYYRKNTSLESKSDNQQYSIMDLAMKRFEDRDYEDCIHILKYQYKNLDNDSGANNILSLCNCYLKNLNDAVYYINKAIELDDSIAIYHQTKGRYLCKSGLYKEGVICFNQAIKLAKNEDAIREYTQDIISVVNMRIKFFHPSDLIDKERFEEFIVYFDSIINSEFCFPELKEQFKQFKKEGVSNFYNYTYMKYNDCFSNMSDVEIVERCHLLLSLNDLSPDLREKVEDICDECKKRIKKENKKNNFIDDLIEKGYSLSEIKEAFRNKFPNSYFDGDGTLKKINKFKKSKLDNSNNSSINSLSKYEAIKDMMDEDFTKSEMIEQLSADFGISEESAEATINSYYKDDDLQLGNYFDDLLEDDEDD